MLKGISPILSPELLSTLYKMGHGDEIILADAHYPAYSFNANILRADGIQIPDLLAAILPLFELDQYSDHPLVMMEAVEGDVLDPDVELRYLKSIHLSNPDISPIERIGRFAFYERSKKAFAVVVTGETAKYGNIILKKGVTPNTNL
ncbi:L-fucose mutarotase [Saccharicrinis carchari]|uniref:L-fucose mutarotase n=1 Tax=Saccharicrinis carchari TaxID=1168039 RepID=A0A521DDM0_SACCC|nr:L-fucose mutarotase [Saccharicrinis carchari]SMO69746.1 L-fucose mutarotase [Saccharicrinis carchari]